MASLQADSPRRLSLRGMSTGTKMLLILTAALLPLGLIAFFASIQSARAKYQQREADARLVATAEARQIDILLLRGSNLIRGTLAMRDIDGRRCPALLKEVDRVFEADVRLALFDAGGLVRCASPGMDVRHPRPPRGSIGIDLALAQAPAGLRFTLAGSEGSYGVGELPIALLRRVMPTDPSQSIVVRQGTTRLRLSAPVRGSPLSQRLAVSAPIANGQAALDLAMISNPISAVEILLVLLPLMMWAAAAMIGWIVVDYLLVRPLAQLQRAVVAYGAGDGSLDLPRITTPSQEMRGLADAFEATARRLAGREAELEQGLEHQVRLTREVHHRVKNNLQVVASLINLHSRGTQGDVAGAYASIQRRVDALAVVHRNHYAELEENRGVALRSIVAELTANLRSTAPPSASNLTITLDMMPAFVTQDVAVPVAFLLTEIVELIMTCDAAGGVAIALTPGAAADRALLSIRAPGLTEERCSAHSSRERFDRIIVGLSRQLRSPLDYDGSAGRYQIAIAVLPQEEG